MAETVAQLVAGAAAAAERAGESYAKGDLDLAVSASKVLLSFGSRLHSRLAAMRDLREEGFWTAEVDRALASKGDPRPSREDKPRGGAKGKGTP